MVPYVRAQNRMWRLPLLAMEDVFAAMHARWSRHQGNTHRAA